VEVAVMRLKPLLILLALIAVISGGCSDVERPGGEFSSSLVVRGVVTDSLGAAVPGAAVAIVALSLPTCTGFTWATDTTTTDSTGHYSTHLTNMGGPQSVSVSANPPPTTGLVRKTSCQGGLVPVGPVWRDTVTIDFVLGGA
jgi:hypothetical protein